jgi:ketosteroid isomerase-like protein
MHPNEGLIVVFYRAFAARDADGMAACYHPRVHFTDEVFDLHGPEVGAMWSMLCERGADLEIGFSGIEADDREGRAHWEASYTFGATGRPVRNSIDARFEFEDGKILRHVDAFDFWKWSRQALGLPGWLLGWSGLLRGKVAAKATRQLAKYQDSLQSASEGFVRSK